MELESGSELGVRVGQCDKALGFNPPPPQELHDVKFSILTLGILFFQTEASY